MTDRLHEALCRETRRLLPSDRYSAAYTIRSALSTYAKLQRDGKAPSLDGYDGAAGNRVFSVDLDQQQYERWGKDQDRIRKIVWWHLGECSKIKTPVPVVCDAKEGVDYNKPEGQLVAEYMAANAERLKGVI